MFSLFLPKTQVFHWQMNCSEDRRNYSEFYQNQSLLTSSFLLEGITIFYFNFISSVSCVFLALCQLSVTLVSAQIEVAYVSFLHRQAPCLFYTCISPTRKASHHHTLGRCVWKDATAISVAGTAFRRRAALGPCPSASPNVALDSWQHTELGETLTMQSPPYGSPHG